MQTHLIENYYDFKIEWLIISSFKLQTYNNNHGIQIHYEKDEHDVLVGFIEGYEWYHSKKGPCKIYILSPDSKEWGELTSESEQILKDTKASAYEILEQGKLGGRINNNIYAHANG